MKLAFNVPIAKFSDYFGSFQLVYWRLGFRKSFFVGFFFSYFSLTTVKGYSEYQCLQNIMAKKSLQFGLLLNGEKTDNWLSDFYYVAIFHLLNPCNQKDKHDLHNKIYVCRQTYRVSAGLSEEEITSMNWASLCNWCRLNLNKQCLAITQQNRTLVLISCFGISVAEALQVSTPFTFAARYLKSGKRIAAESTSCSLCLAAERLTSVVKKIGWCWGRSSQWQYAGGGGEGGGRTRQSRGGGEGRRS